MPSNGRGIRQKLAEVTRCQAAYITHVLSGDYHFSPEQAEAICRFFQFNDEETEFFMLLVSFNRAGTHELKQYLQNKIDEQKAAHLLLKNRLKIAATLSRDDQALYYSQWYFAAAHMALTIPGVETRDQLASKLKLSQKTTNRILQTLTNMGLIEKSARGYAVTSQQLHLEAKSPLIPSLHKNWRLAAISSLQEEQPADMHYSTVFTCSAKDLPLLREKLTQSLEECIKLIKPSKEEKLASICVDLFEL